MGFRDLAMFNDLLLAKQAWQLLNDKNSLFYRISKARFFPHYSIMEAADSRSSSFAWKSILYGKDVNLRDAKCRIGNGKSTQIYNNRWLPSKTQHLILSPIVESMSEATVDILINLELKRLNTDMVDGLFTAQEADTIKNIPLAGVETDDTLYWPLTHDGQYTCKSGYRFRKEEIEPEHQRLPSPEETQLWRHLWSLRTPNKVKNHVWRACHDSLPTEGNLERRTIISNPICDRYELHPESPLHALWLFPKLNEVWNNSKLWGSR